jgi:thymidylate kinase
MEIYTFLRRNRAILRALNNGSSVGPRWRPKRRFVEQAVSQNQYFAQSDRFAHALRRKISQVSERMRLIGVDMVFVKAANDFPLDSHNFDVLVRPEDLVDANDMLESLGFTELRHVREPFKWLYRRVDSDFPISIHIHTGLGWEGVGFLDASDVWNMRREVVLAEGLRVAFPSAEHHILMTAAHAFFENQCLKLCDLIYMAEAAQCESRINWDDIAEWCARDHWLQTLSMFLELADHVYNKFYGRTLVDKGTFGLLTERKSAYLTRERNRLVRGFDKDMDLPMKFHVACVARSFISKVFRTSGKSRRERIATISSASRGYVKRRVPLAAGLRPRLVCFSGQDGTGKTRHARYLSERLVDLIHTMNDEMLEKGFKVRYVWSRGAGSSSVGRSMMEPLLRFARRLLLRSDLRGLRELALRREKLLKTEPARTLWACAVLTDELLQLLLKIRLPSTAGEVVICDRYVYDAVVDVECELGVKLGVVRNAIERLAGRPQLTFVLDAEPTDIMRRRIGSERTVVECKRRSYLRYLTLEGSALINTAKDFGDNEEVILSRVLRSLLLR